MTDYQDVGAALFFSAVLGAIGVVLVGEFVPQYSHSFSLFWIVGTVGLCMVASGDTDD